MKVKYDQEKIHSELKTLAAEQTNLRVIKISENYASLDHAGMTQKNLRDLRDVRDALLYILKQSSFWYGIKYEKDETLSVFFAPTKERLNEIIQLRKNSLDPENTRQRQGSSYEEIIGKHINEAIEDWQVLSRWNVEEINDYVAKYESVFETFGHFERGLRIVNTETPEPHQTCDGVLGIISWNIAILKRKLSRNYVPIPRGEDSVPKEDPETKKSLASHPMSSLKGVRVTFSKSSTGKDPSSPKHPASGYMFYGEYRRPILKAEHPEYGFGELTKTIAHEWNTMTDAQKAPYLKQAEKDKRRYEVEKLKYEEDTFQ